MLLRGGFFRLGVWQNIYGQDLEDVFFSFWLELRTRREARVGHGMKRWRVRSIRLRERNTCVFVFGWQKKLRRGMFWALIFFLHKFVVQALLLANKFESVSKRKQRSSPWTEDWKICKYIRHKKWRDSTTSICLAFQQVGGGAKDGSVWTAGCCQGDQTWGNKRICKHTRHSCQVLMTLSNSGIDGFCFCSIPSPMWKNVKNGKGCSTGKKRIRQMTKMKRTY